jgi:hypothetical protein
MSRTVDVTIHLSVPDEVDAGDAAESIFNALCQYADEDLVESVDGWDLPRPTRIVGE